MFLMISIVISGFFLLANQTIEWYFNTCGLDPASKQERKSDSYLLHEDEIFWPWQELEIVFRDRFHLYMLK